MLIAEVGLAHDGSLGNALAFIDAVAAAGADAVKFQCHLGDTNTKPPQSGCELIQDGGDRLRYWERTGFNDVQWSALRAYAKLCGIKFGYTPFSIEALEFIQPLAPDFIKISRNRHDLIDPVRELGKYTIITVQENNYLGPGIHTVQMDRFIPHQMHSGISDHSGTIWPCIRAAALGAEIFEVHVTWDRRAFGPDSQYSLTINELKMLREGIDAVQQSG